MKWWWKKDKNNKMGNNPEANWSDKNKTSWSDKDNKPGKM